MQIVQTTLFGTELRLLGCLHYIMHSIQNSVGFVENERQIDECFLKIILRAEE